MISWLIRILKGIIIALGFILPGVSGGVLAAILGIYERMIYFLAHIRENFRDNVLYFLPVGIGTVLGIALFSLPVDYFLEHYKIIVLWGFAGAIIGTIPSLLNESVRESDRDRTDVIWFLTTFLISGICLYFLNSFVGTLPANFLTFILAGALIALGILVPGLSPSNLLLILGLYSPMNFFTNRNRRSSRTCNFFKIYALCFRKLSFSSISFYHWDCLVEYHSHLGTKSWEQ